MRAYEEIYPKGPKEIVCGIALNIQEAKKLREQGFRYETGEYNDGGKLFYKKIYLNLSQISKKYW